MSLNCQSEGLKGPIKPYSKNGGNWVEVLYPIETVSEANGGMKKKYMRKGKLVQGGEGWWDKSARHKKQKGAVYLMLNLQRKHLKLPCKITLTRYGPQKLDRYDNLPMSLKYVLDACCEVITGDYRPGRADDTEEIEVAYKQVYPSDHAVKIHIEML